MSHIVPTFFFSSPRHHSSGTDQPGWSAAAIDQHRVLIDNLTAAGADLVDVPGVPAVDDSVFIRDRAVLRVDQAAHPRALLAKPRAPDRRAAQGPWRPALTALGVRVNGQTRMHFAGADLLSLPRKRGAFLGYGFSSQWRASREIEDFTGAPVTTLRLVDPSFDHLDVALNVIATDEGLIAFALKDAFAPESWEDLSHHPALSRVVPVSRADAAAFGLAWVEVGDLIFVGADVPALAGQLTAYGRRVVVSPLDQYHRAGGGAARLVARVHDGRSSEEAKQQHEIGGRDRHERGPRDHRRRPTHAKHAHQRLVPREAY